MKCPNCGSEARPSANRCGVCGRLLTAQTKVQKPGTRPEPTAPPQPAKPAPSAGHVVKFTHADVAKKLKFDYMYGSKESIDKAFVSLEPLHAAHRRPKLKVHDLLEEAANIIYKQLRIREVSIGLRDPKDGLYRYMVMAGMRNGIWKAHGDLAYTKDDFFRNDKWKGTAISKYTKILLTEDNPYEDGEQDTYDRQETLNSKRHNLDDSIEGDYLDIMIYGLNDDLIGWIEISGTWTSKIPDPHTIRLIELVSCTLGSILSSNSSASIYSG